MDEKLVNSILYNLKELNEELNVAREKINDLNSYNEQFINKVVQRNQLLLDDEEEYSTKIQGILEFISQKQRASTAVLEKEKRINSIIFEERFNINRDIYETELRNITSEMDKYVALFEKQLSNISYATYYKNLDVLQTTNEYDKSLNTIKNNYLDAINYFHYDKERKISSIEKEENSSRIELDDTLSKIDAIFQREIEEVEEEKNEHVLNVKKNQIENEKLLLNQKIETNQKIEEISNLFKKKLDNEVIPFKNHLAYLNNELTSTIQELKDKELVILDEFKINLELVDKQTEIFKQDVIKKQDEIDCDISITKDKNECNSLTKKRITLDNQFYQFNEKMRARKLEFDTLKEYKIKKLNLAYDVIKDSISKKIELFQNKIKTIENIYSLNEYINLSEIRYNAEIQELKIKNDLDNIKQANYLIDDHEKLNSEYYSKIHDYQVKLHNDALTFNDTLYSTIKSNVATLLTLEMEKNLILKKYNTTLNSLLRKKIECSSSLIKLDEEYEIKQKRVLNDLRKKVLSQDIQLANKKNNLQKTLLTVEQSFFENNITNDERFKLETQTYKIFESRFIIEKQLYELYFTNILDEISAYSLYFTKYNSITRCSNINITGSTFNFLIKHLQTTIQSLLKKIVKITTDRINFEGTINFQYELNRLIEERNQNKEDYDTTSSKMDETVDNYQNTINLYRSKIEHFEREIYKSENSLVLNNMDLSKLDYKNPTAINKLHNEIAGLKESIVEYKKEIKVYEELIYKNEKLIVDLTKSIGRLKRKFNKTSHILDNQLETIEKRHKSESSVYFKFIFKIEELDKLFKMNVTKSKDEDTYRNYKKYISTIQSIIQEFKNNEISTLFDKLESRQEVLIEQSIVKNNERTIEIKDMFDIDVKTVSTKYNEEVLEIEKKIEKLNSHYESNLKSITSLHKDRTIDIKNKIKNIDIIITQKKAELLYDINSFNENIRHFYVLNEKKIINLKSGRKELSNEYFKFSDSLSDDRKNKKQSLKVIHNNVTNSLSINYKNIIKEKRLVYSKKSIAYKNQIEDFNQLFKESYINYNKFNLNRDAEYNLEEKNLKKELELALRAIKKRSNIKINKENKKYNKQINT